ncbi:MAG: hypothetical protein ACE5GH_00630 [Fidelibacterota bacterium]
MRRVANGFVIILSVLLSILHGGVGEKKFSLILEGRGGLFRPAPEKFASIYGNNSVMKSATLGLGYGKTFLVARYRLFEANGKSVVSGIDLDGSANWRQEFISLGIRSYAQNLFYAELAYVVASVEESISTSEPAYTALNSTYSTDNNRGASVAIGITLPIVLGFNLSGEVEYVFVETTEPGRTKEDKLNIGGPTYGLGISFVF